MEQSKLAQILRAEYDANIDLPPSERWLKVAAKVIEGMAPQPSGLYTYNKRRIAEELGLPVPHRTPRRHGGYVRGPKYQPQDKRPSA